MSLPIFPQSKNLTVSDKNAVESITSQFEPYSDFNFVSLFSWDIDNTLQISMLDENLVVKFHDYLTNEAFYSLIGKNNIPNSVNTLLLHAAREGINEYLSLIPEEIVQSIVDASLQEEYSMIADRGNFDYILSLQDLATFEPSHYQKKRNLSNRFQRDFPSAKVSIINIEQGSVKKEVMELFHLWEKQHNKKKEDTHNECEAVKKLLMTPGLPLISLGIFYQDKLIGFNINEVTSKKYAITHFEKFNADFYGLTSYMKQVTAEHLLRKNCLYLNYEQDLDLPNLRFAKELLHPVKYLKKFTIKKKTMIQ